MNSQHLDSEPVPSSTGAKDPLDSCMSFHEDKSFLLVRAPDKDSLSSKMDMPFHPNGLTPDSLWRGGDCRSVASSWQRLCKPSEISHCHLSSDNRDYCLTASSDWVCCLVFNSHASIYPLADDPRVSRPAHLQITE